MDINDDLIFKKRKDVIERFGEELLLFDSPTGKLFEVNDTGKTIWSMLDGKHTVKDIKKQLKREFQVIRESDKDVLEFLSKLNEMDLIEKL